MHRRWPAPSGAWSPDGESRRHSVPYDYVHQVRVDLEELIPYPGWHCVWIDEVEDGWLVSCIPHGEIARETSAVAAFEAALQHDHQNGTAML